MVEGVSLFLIFMYVQNIEHVFFKFKYSKFVFFFYYLQVVNISYIIYFYFSSEK